MAIESLELARHRIAERLKIPLELVYAQFKYENGKMHPQIDLADEPQTRALDQDETVRIITECYARARRLMTERLPGVKQRRFYEQET